MATIFNQSRTHILLGFCLPLAVLIGFLLAEPMQIGSLTMLLAVLGMLVSPLLFRWHHPFLVASWNAAIILTFLPGAPPLWMLMAAVSFLIVVLNRATSDRFPLRHVPSVTRPLLVLLGVVFLTALVTGGFGIRSLGSDAYGGKGYFYIAIAAAGYLGLAGCRVPPNRAGLYAALFFLPGMTSLLSNLAYSGGSSFWWLFYVLPGKFAYEQMLGDLALNADMTRIGGVGPASVALICGILAVWGLRGLFDFRAPWRLFLFVAAFVGCAYSGFRSHLVLFSLVVVFQFFLEGLHRSPKLPIIGGIFALLCVLALANAERLPLVMQRTLSILPVPVSYEARRSAEDSNQWRLEMWRSLLDDVPRYLLKGKGYVFDPNQLGMAVESASRGYGGRYQHAAAAGDYHNGPFSVIIPFGIWGVAAFLWLLFASVQYLYWNFRRGDPALRKLNTFLLAFFLSKAVFFLLVYGVLYSDLAVFLGVVGFAAAFNGSGRTRVGKLQGAARLARRTSADEGSQSSGSEGVEPVASNR